MNMPDSIRRTVRLSTVLLNWNRSELLRRTVESYLSTVTVEYELIIVDNASTDESRAFIENACKTHQNCHAVLLPENIGGEAINAGIARSSGPMIHVSENDLEYLPGWDVELLVKFDRIPELGQLSLFSPFHQVELGEIWTDKAAIRCTRGERTFYWATDNVGTSSLFRREIWERGVRWRSHGSQTFQSPDDCGFSRDVKKLGYRVAWNDRYVVVNWGHHVSEMSKRLNYYFNNAESKPYLGIERLKTALSEHGYEIVRENGQCSIRQNRAPADSKAWAKTELWKEWMEWLRMTVEELDALIPRGDSFAFIDEQQFGEELIPERRHVPFPASDGEYCGPPADDDAAIRELNSLGRRGVKWVVFAWPAFWWFEYYQTFSQHLQTHSREVLHNDRVRVFRVQ